TAVGAHGKCGVKRTKIPAPHKDLNEWTRAGATTDDLLAAMVNAETVREAAPVLNSLNSFNSLARDGGDELVDAFPEPPSEVAFQGLAGDIVRRIEPHT